VGTSDSTWNLFSPVSRPGSHNPPHPPDPTSTEIDRTASAGLTLGGRRWCRPNDRVGLAGVLNGLSGPHRHYLGAGGFGFIIGDGRLSYGPEEILAGISQMSVDLCVRDLVRLS
jgi:hypothetical protein